MIDGVTIHRAALDIESLAHLWDCLNSLPFTRIERGAMHLSRALQDDNTGSERAAYLVNYLKARGVGDLMPFDDVSVVRYDRGSDYVDWHSDGGPLLESGCAMGILSLGATRALEFRRIGSDVTSERVYLRAGDVVVSAPGLQFTHQHRIPPVKQDGLRFSIVLFTHAKARK